MPEPVNSDDSCDLVVRDLGRMSYGEALALQRTLLNEVVSWRDEVSSRSSHPAGYLLLLEHDPPVVTVTRRPAAASHITGTPAHFAEAGVELHETDRGGDVTYHGPGQLVAYPIIDLNRLSLRIHEYVRVLEAAIIRTLTEVGITGERDPGATGVWVAHDARGTPLPQPAKIAAIGVRVSRWVSMHGLALNVTTNLSHFDLIVPCGLTGRPVTSLEALGAYVTMDHVRQLLPRMLMQSLEERGKTS